MPNGVITFRRRSLPNNFSLKWSESRNGLAPMHLTTAKKIEDIDCTLQVNDFFIHLSYNSFFFLG